MIFKTLEEFFLNQLEEKDAEIASLKEGIKSTMTKKITGLKVSHFPDYYRLKNDGVIEILYHESLWDGDKHFCDIKYDSGSIVRVFDIERVFAEGED